MTEPAHPPGPGMPSAPGPPPASRPPAGGPPATPPPAPPASLPEPSVPDELRNLWAWARGYIKRFNWQLAPVWLPAAVVPGAAREGMVGCCCKDGESCTVWGKHLVSGLGVARQEDEVELVWPSSDVRVRAGMIGIAVLTGSDSRIVVLDIGEHAEMTRARFRIVGHVLTQTTPTGGSHWFFRIGDGEAVTGGRSEIELVAGVTVLGDGGFVPLPPRRGYHWADGPKAAMAAGITPATDALMMRLTAAGLVHGIDDIHPDSPWRTRPGTPLISGAPRTYTRRGDVRRLVDHNGDRILFTPGLGWRVWTESGWGGPERSETEVRSMIMALPDVHIVEARESKARGDDSRASAALKWSTRSAQRPSSSVYGDLQTDERILVPSTGDWDAEGWVAGLPVTSGVGRLVNLRTGAIELDARTRRVSKTLGAAYEEGPGGELKRLWEIGADGGAGRYFVKYLTDLETQHGPEWIRLLQRAAGASLYGRRGVEGDVDAVYCLKGPSRSGKSTFAECLLAVSGQYGKAMGPNLLFGDKGNPEFANSEVLGVRVMTLSEPPMSAELNTTKLKQLSGGDSITGRAPYGREEISFTPEVSLWLSTNHSLEISDEAVWRRMKVFEFEHAWTEGGGELPALRYAVTRDPHELRLAFAWMLAGAMDWYRHGWGDTTVWREAVSMERAKHDPIARWVAENVTLTGVATDAITYADLMSDFDMWLIMSAETKPAMSRNALRDELEGACVRAGLRIDKTRRALTGGRLT